MFGYSFYGYMFSGLVLRFGSEVWFWGLVFRVEFEGWVWGLEFLVGRSGLSVYGEVFRLRCSWLSVRVRCLVGFQGFGVGFRG